jgi:hypothetical protein
MKPWRRHSRRKRRPMPRTDPRPDPRRSCPASSRNSSARNFPGPRPPASPPSSARRSSENLPLTPVSTTQPPSKHNRVQSTTSSTPPPSETTTRGWQSVRLRRTSSPWAGNGREWGHRHPVTPRRQGVRMAPGANLPRRAHSQIARRHRAQVHQHRRLHHALRGPRCREPPRGVHVA